MLNTLGISFWLESPLGGLKRESIHSGQCGLIPISVSANHFPVFGRRLQAQEDGQMVESQYGTNTNALIKIVAKVPIGIIPIAVQGLKGTQPVNQSVLSLFLFHSHRDVLNCFRFSSLEERENISPIPHRFYLTISNSSMHAKAVNARLNRT